MPPLRVGVGEDDMTKNDLRLTQAARIEITRETDALCAVLIALSPLDFHERRRILRWVCDHYGLAADQLDHKP